MLRSPSNTAHRQRTGSMFDRHRSISRVATGALRPTDGSTATRSRSSPRDGGWREAADGDGAWRALAAAIAEGRTIPALAADDRRRAGTRIGAGQVDAALVCRPSPGFADAVGRRPGRRSATPTRSPLGRDQSNTSVVLGGRLLLKAYRRIQPGLNPDLELTAYLSEEAAFAGRAAPRRLGRGRDPRRRRRDRRDAPGVRRRRRRRVRARPPSSSPGSSRRPGPRAWSGRPRSPRTSGRWSPASTRRSPRRRPMRRTSPRARRPTTSSRPGGSTRTGSSTSRCRPSTAVDRAGRRASSEREASAIAARVSRFEAVATTPARDAHPRRPPPRPDPRRGRRLPRDRLRGRAAAADRGPPPARTRRCATSPRCSARSTTWRGARGAGPRSGPAARSSGRASTSRRGSSARGSASSPRTPTGLRQAGAPITLDLDLLDAFEVAKEAYEFVYAATVLPSWLWAPRDGMRWLLDHGEGPDVSAAERTRVDDAARRTSSPAPDELAAGARPAQAQAIADAPDGRARRGRAGG